MGSVLFSPIGNTDPIRGFHDGAWLHICRHYQPHTCFVYLTAEMCRREDVIEADGNRKDLYARTLRLLNAHLYGDQTDSYIKLRFERDRQCENAHSFEYFMPVFLDILNRIHAEYPDDELLINGSSGTPGMKGTLMALSALLPYPVRLIQVSDYEKDQNKKELPINNEYPVVEAWELNEDNEPGARDRTSPQPLVNLVLEMRIGELCRLVQEGDYHTALLEAQGDSLKARIPTKALFALQGADYRSSMNLRRSASALIRSGFAQGETLRKHADERVWQCAEYLLTMQNDLRRGEYDDFLRKLTPLLVNLCELYLAKIGKDVRANGVDNNDKWQQEKIPKEWLTILNGVFWPKFRDDADLSAASMLPLIRRFGEPRAAELAAMLREVERTARNPVAHRIVPFGRAEIETELRKTGNKETTTPEDLANRLREFLELIQPFGASYWHSYAAMSEHICLLLKEG